MASLLSRIVGHHDVIRSLLEACAKNRLPSTLLFCGPSGIGKRRVALGLAQRLVCERPESDVIEACGQCGPCVRIEKCQSESLLSVEPDGNTIKIEQARDCLQFLTLRRLGRARIVLIDQAHLLNPQSGNALLKALEEPPPSSYFFLVTSLPESLLSTIRSRAQAVRFRPLLDEELAQILGPDTDAWVIASAQGSVEVAARLLENRDEFKEISTVAADFISAALERFPSDETARLKELTKDRGAQSFATGLFQFVLVNALRSQSGVPMRTRAREPWDGIARIAARIPADRLAALAESAVSMEHEMARNVDRGLLLENFAIELKRATE